MTTELEQRLRDALHHDAQRAQLVNPDGPPETEARPLSADEDAPPRRLRWTAVAAAVAALALGVAVALVDEDQDVDTVPPATHVTEPAVPMRIADADGELELGTYLIDPDGDPSTPMTVTFEIAAPDWLAWIGADKANVPNTMLSITTVTNLVVHACDDHRPADPSVGPTVDDLTTALSQLAPFEVTAPPSDVSLFGYAGKHLELAIPDGIGGCEEDLLHSWVAPGLGGAFNGYNGIEPGLREEFWILDVDGTRLVLVYNTSPDAPAEAIAERQAIFDSIQIQP